MPDQVPNQTEPQAEPTPVRLFNRSTDKKILAWGKGVIMPGESFLTTTPEAYGANEPGSDWVTDEEAAAAVAEAHAHAQAAVQAAQAQLQAVEARADAAIANAQQALDQAELAPANPPDQSPDQSPDHPANPPAEAADTGGTA